MLVLSTDKTDSIVLLLTNNMSDAWFDCPSALSPTTLLPEEILEIIIIRSTVALFVDLKAEEAEPERITLQTTMSVCFTWWAVLTKRKWNKQQLRHTFDGTL